MLKRSYTVSITVEVWDTEDLAQAARSRAIAHGIETQDWDETRLRSDPIAADLQMLLDPGVSPPGTDIQDSSVEFHGLIGEDDAA